MKRFYFLIFHLLFTTAFYAQVNTANLAGKTSIYFVDGIKVEKNLSQENRSKVLKAFIKLLNGNWKDDSLNYIVKYNLSNITYKGTSIIPNELNIDPINVRLDIIDGKLSLLTNELKTVDGDTSNILINKNKLIVGSRSFTRQKNN